MPALPEGSGEALARLAHLAPLLRGRRVLLLGGDAEAGAAFAAGHAAAVETAPAAHGLPAEGFDLVVLQDPREDVTAQLPALRALVAPGGTLAVAAAPGARDGVLEALRAAFPSVEVAAVWPLAAWAVAPSGARPGQVTWDGSMLAGALASSYLLLCGAAPTGLAEATVAALPAPVPAADAGEARASEEVRAILAQADAAALGDRAALERAAAREAELEAEVTSLLWQKDEAEAALARAVAERDRLAAARDPAAAPGGDDVPDLLPG